MTKTSTYTIWNVTGAHYPVGSYISRNIADGHLARLREEFPSDTFELRAETR